MTKGKWTSGTKAGGIRWWQKVEKGQSFIITIQPPGPSDKGGFLVLGSTARSGLGKRPPATIFLKRTVDTEEEALEKASEHRQRIDGTWTGE